MLSHSIKNLAQKINAVIIGDDSILISKCASIKNAKSGDITFYLAGNYKKYLADTQASAVILKKEDADNCPITALIVDNPELAFARIAALFEKKYQQSGVHPSAIISPSAKIDPTTSIGANCFVGDHVEIGPDCIIYPNVTIYHHVKINKKVILHSGAVIGADGFGYVRNEKNQHEKIPQLGAVEIGDDVEIGVNTCIDRGALDNTIIGSGVKIDNLVQIAHNVIIGENTIIAGCSAIAGSTVIGKQCMIAGAVNIAGHLTICDHCIFTGGAAVTKSISEPGIYSSGTGLMPHASWRRSVVNFRKSGK